MTSHTQQKPVYIVSGIRTPFLKARGKPGPFSAADLAVFAARTLLLRQSLDPKYINEVVIGCVAPSVDEANIARIIALRLGCMQQVPAWTVQRNCGSGMQALDSAARSIASGRADIVLAGGTEAMSRAPLLLHPDMIAWLAALRMADSLLGRLHVMRRFRPRFCKPVVALIRGLSDPTISLNMGQTAEILANRFDISREMMDDFAFKSHQKLAQAQSLLSEQELVPLYDSQGGIYSQDGGLRTDTDKTKLACLKPLFDKPFGLVAAGNSSQITDGAAILMLASEAAVDKHCLPVLGRLIDTAWAALDPQVMGLGPVFATTPLLMRHKLALDAIDYFEINEAFAAQVLACLRAFEDKAFCQNQLKIPDALGALDTTRLNIHGGAIAMGHPVGASGARIVLHLLQVLKQKNAKRGIATLCIGGGQGGAMLLERA